MPAHITHELFAAEAFSRAFGAEAVPSLDDRYWVFDAQGPDFFLHNHRTNPSGLVFGKLLHGEGYGAFTRHLLRIARRSSAGIDSSLGAYTLGFVTHAVLDRRAHPFINYYSGWVERDVPDSIRYHNLHAFFERIIDVVMFKRRTGRDIGEYDFFSRVDCGKEMPASLLDAVTEALQATYPEYRGRRDTRARVRNAYRDTIRFYRLTNPLGGDRLRRAYERDGGHRNGERDPTRRFLALFHPRRMRRLDYLNENGDRWNYPDDPAECRTSSFVELFDIAVGEAQAPLRCVARVLRGEAAAETAEAVVGNGNLSDGRTRSTRRRLDYVNPLPLDEVLADVYEAVAGGVGSI